MQEIKIPSILDRIPETIEKMAFKKAPNMNEYQKAMIEDIRKELSHANLAKRNSLPGFGTKEGPLPEANIFNYHSYKMDSPLHKKQNTGMFAG